MELGEVPLETRCRAVLDVLTAEPRMSIWRRAELLGVALWPRPSLTPEPPPPPGPVWRKRGKASTPAERADVVALLDEGWT
ncbi:MAG TPA: hypothetical protein VLB81_01990 [Gaiellales bacterium]|nr:hypothetical protein [Gaiellales bacterium]